MHDNIFVSVVSLSFMRVWMEWIGWKRYRGWRKLSIFSEWNFEKRARRARKQLQMQNMICERNAKEFPTISFFIRSLITVINVFSIPEYLFILLLSSCVANNQRYTTQTEAERERKGGRDGQRQRKSTLRQQNVQSKDVSDMMAKSNKFCRRHPDEATNIFRIYHSKNERNSRKKRDMHASKMVEYLQQKPFAQCKTVTHTHLNIPNARCVAYEIATVSRLIFIIT